MYMYNALHHRFNKSELTNLIIINASLLCRKLCIYIFFNRVGMGWGGVEEMTV